MYKFGVQLHRDTKEALLFGKLNQKELWKEAIAKEMSKIMENQVFKKTPDGHP